MTKQFSVLCLDSSRSLSALDSLNTREQVKNHKTNTEQAHKAWSVNPNE